MAFEGLRWSQTPFWWLSPAGLAVPGFGYAGASVLRGGTGLTTAVIRSNWRLE